MRVLYKETFSEIRASERLREEVQGVTRQSRKPKQQWKLLLIPAAVIMLILAGVAGASDKDIREPLREDLDVIEERTMEEELGQSWTENGGILDEAQKQRIAQAVQTVNISDTRDGVTVTVEQIYATEHHLSMLMKIQGEDLANLHHTDLRTYTLSGTVSGHPETAVSYGYLGSTDLGTLEDGTLLRSFECAISQEELSLLDGAELELRMKNLKVFGDTEWILPISIAPAENREILTLEQARAGGYLNWDHDNYRKPEDIITLQNLEVSSTGFQFRTLSGWPGDVFVCLTDGQEIKSLGAEGGGTTGSPMEFAGCWPAPVDLNLVMALKIGEILIPLY